MSDLALPFLLLFEDDSLAFWCFEKLMRKVRLNFEVSSKGILAKLDKLARILKVVDPELHEKLEQVGRACVKGRDPCVKGRDPCVKGRDPNA